MNLNLGNVIGRWTPFRVCLDCSMQSCVYTHEQIRSNCRIPLADLKGMKAAELTKTSKLQSLPGAGATSRPQGRVHFLSICRTGGMHASTPVPIMCSLVREGSFQVCMRTLKPSLRDKIGSLLTSPSKAKQPMVYTSGVSSSRVDLVEALSDS